MEQIIQIQLVDKLIQLRNGHFPAENPIYYGDWQAKIPPPNSWSAVEFQNFNQDAWAGNLYSRNVLTPRQDTDLSVEEEDTQEQAENQYKPIWMPSPSWPETAEHLNLEVDNFLDHLRPRIFLFVPLEKPALRCNRKKDLGARRSQLEAELAELDKAGKGRLSPEAYNEEVTKLKRKLEQNENTESKRKRLLTELEARKKLFENVQESERNFKRDVYLMSSRTIRANYHSDPLLKGNMQRILDAVHDFVENRQENIGVLDSNNTTRNKYRLQLAGWKWEHETYQILTKILERLVRITWDDGPSTSSQNQTNTIDMSGTVNRFWRQGHVRKEEAKMSDEVFCDHLMVREPPKSPGISEEDEAMDEEELSDGPNGSQPSSQESKMPSDVSGQSPAEHDSTVELVSAILHLSDERDNLL